jgi:RHS repeat-associated protein
VKKNDTIVAEYGYDPNGIRVVKRKYVNGAFSEKTHYVFEGAEPIFEKRIKTGQSDRIRSYVYAMGMHLARVNGVIGDENAPKYFYHTDHLGSVKAVTDQTGAVVYNADYTPFGTQFFRDSEFDELHGFTGKEYDLDIGLYYYNARWYDPDTGRFISEDPAGDPNNPNLYSYCGNNPIMRADPTGKFWQFLIPALIGGVCAYANGGDFMQGFAMGLMTGGISIGIGEVLANTALGTVLKSFGTSVVSGGISGGITSMISGGDFWSGVGMGAFSAGIGFGLDKYIPGGKDIFNSTSPVVEAFIYAFKAEVKSLVTTGKDVGFLSLVEGLAGDYVDKSAQEFNNSGPTLSEAADIADHVYGKEGAELSGGWELVDVYSPEGTGLRMGVYARVGADGTTEYVIANAGTEFTNLKHWKNNVQQPFGASPDMRESIDYATKFVKRNPNANITFVGHSKGGAEAAANAVATNRNAILFNPATVNLGAYGLNRSTYAGKMTAYIVKGEILNDIFGPISKPIGSIVYLPQQSWWNPVYNHSMAAVKKAINEWEGQE